MMTSQHETDPGSGSPKEPRTAPHIYRQEQQFMGRLLDLYPDFFEQYRFFLPSGTIDATLAYYQIAPQDQETQHPNQDLIDLVRFAVRQDAPKDLLHYGAPLDNTPLFRVSLKTVTAYEKLLTDTVTTKYSGMVRPDMLSQRNPHPAKETLFYEAQNWFYSACRANPTIQMLFEINQEIIACLEKYYFQGKTQRQIAIESKDKLTIRTVESILKLGLHSLGFPQDLLPAHLRRYKNWLLPLVTDWQAVKKRADSVPRALKEPVWEIIAGRPVKKTAVAHNLSVTKLQRFYTDFIVDGKPAYRTFLTEYRIDEIEKLLHQQHLPYDQMPQVILLRKFIAEKIRGVDLKTAAKKLGVNDRTISAATSHFLSNIRAEFPSEEIPKPIHILLEAPNPFNEGITRASATRQTTWQLVDDYHEKFIAKKLAQEQSLAKEDKRFLFVCLSKLNDGKALTDSEFSYLNLLLGHPNPKAETRERRKLKAAITVKTPAFSTYTPRQQRMISSLAEGKNITTVAHGENISIGEALKVLAEINL